MKVTPPETRNLRDDEQGFTLPELLTAIAIMGILLAIAIIIWLGLLEQRRVDAATKQLVADLRLAHSSATNQLTDWRVVLVLYKADEDDGPDYYLVKLTAPYPGAPPTPVQRIPRTFPANVQSKIPETPSGVIVDDQSAAYWVAPWISPPPSFHPRNPHVRIQHRRDRQGLRGGERFRMRDHRRRPGQQGLRRFRHFEGEGRGQRLLTGE